MKPVPREERVVFGKRVQNEKSIKIETARTLQKISPKEKKLGPRPGEGEGGGLGGKKRTNPARKRKKLGKCKVDVPRS